MILQETFTLARISEAVGKKPTTPRTHINRGLVVGQGPRSMSGDKPSGKHARFSFPTLMEFALAYHLYDTVGVHLDRSFKHAAKFAHIGGGGADFDLPERLPALPFHHKHGGTIWGIASDTSVEIPTFGNIGRDIYGNMRRLLNTEDFILVNASEVFLRVCLMVGHQPDEALDEAYRDG